MKCCKMFYRSANANKLTVVVFALIIIFCIQANFGQYSGICYYNMYYLNFSNILSFRNAIIYRNWPNSEMYVLKGIFS